MIPVTDEALLWKEDHISQIPVLQLLGNLGWGYLTPVLPAGLTIQIVCRRSLLAHALRRL